MKLKPFKPLAEPKPTIGKTGIVLPSWIPVDRIRQFIDQYRAGLAAGGVVALVLIVFGLLYLRHRHTVTERSTVLFREAHDLYLYQIPPPESNIVPLVATEEDKYQRAHQLFQQISSTYPGSHLAPVAMYYVGNCRYRLKQYTQALEAYDQFLARYPSHRMSVQAQLGRADCLEMLSRYQEALLAYQNVVNSGSSLSYEGSLGSARCMLRLGESGQKKAGAGEAIALLNQLGTVKSEYAAKTSRSLRKLLADLSSDPGSPQRSGVASREQPERKASGVELTGKERWSQAITATDIKTGMTQYIIAETKKGNGEFKIHDDKLKKDWALTFVKIHDPVRIIDDKTYFACTDFKSTTSGDVLDLDFWLVPGTKQGVLNLVDTKIHKVNGEPRFTYEGNKLVEVPDRPANAGPPIITGTQPQAWQYDPATNKHWNPDHGHWHDGLPPRNPAEGASSKEHPGQEHPGTPK